MFVDMHPVCHGDTIAVLFDSEAWHQHEYTPAWVSGWVVDTWGGSKALVLYPADTLKGYLNKTHAPLYLQQDLSVCTWRFVHTTDAWEYEIASWHHSSGRYKAGRQSKSQSHGRAECVRPRAERGIHTQYAD